MTNVALCKNEIKCKISNRKRMNNYYAFVCFVFHLFDHKKNWINAEGSAIVRYRGIMRIEEED